MNLQTKRMISNVLKNWIEIHSLFLLNNLFIRWRKYSDWNIILYDWLRKNWRL